MAEQGLGIAELLPSAPPDRELEKKAIGCGRFLALRIFNMRWRMLRAIMSNMPRRMLRAIISNMRWRMLRVIISYMRWRMFRDHRREGVNGRREVMHHRRQYQPREEAA